MSFFFFFSSRRRHTRCGRDWSSDVCSSDLRGRGDLERLRPRAARAAPDDRPPLPQGDRKSTRLNSSHVRISYAVFCLKKKKLAVIVFKLVLLLDRDPGEIEALSLDLLVLLRLLGFFFFNDTATTEIYTLSLHDALPTSSPARVPVFFTSTETVTVASPRSVSPLVRDRKSTRLNSSHVRISYAVFCL